MSKTLERRTGKEPAVDVEIRVHEAIRCRIAACPYAFVFGKVAWHYADGTLTLCGSVPSFYLKQTLQELLRNIENVDRVVNEVDVVSATGLSSVRAK